MRTFARSLVIASLAAASLGLAQGCETTEERVEQKVLISDYKKKDKDDKDLPTSDFEKSIPELVQLTEKEPQEGKWHFLLGLRYEERKQFDLAEYRYRKVLAILPPGKYTGAHYRLGRVLVLQKKYEPALQELLACVSIKQPEPDIYYLNPDYRESYYLLGVIYEHIVKDEAKAVANYNQFVRYGGELNRVGSLVHKLELGSH